MFGFAFPLKDYNSNFSIMATFCAPSPLAVQCTDISYMIGLVWSKILRVRDRQLDFDLLIMAQLV